MKNKIYLSLLFAALFTFMFCEFGFAQSANYYNVNSGTGKGLRLWGGSNNYKIHMGATSPYKYGPVTSYSIKTNMSNHSNRGWTWGVLNATPVAALNTQGNFQIKGWMKNMSRNYYFGNTQRLHGDNSSALYWTNNHSTITQLIMRDKQGTIYGRLYGSGNGVNFGLLDGDGNWSYLAAKDNYTAFRINNSEKMRIKSNGYVGIGTTTPNNELDVNGTIRAKEIKVESGWSDYVFYEDYQLPTLEDEEKYIKENGHLLGFESEKAMDGEIQLGDVSRRQQAKIEEMMLHLIQISEKLQNVEAKVSDLEQENTQLKKQLSKQK